MSQINTWLEEKIILPKALNYKIDFGIDNHPERSSEFWLPAIPLKSKYYSDTGYRLRRNDFKMNDSWVPFFGKHKHTFFDFTFFNSD